MLPGQFGWLSSCREGVKEDFTNVAVGEVHPGHTHKSLSSEVQSFMPGALWQNAWEVPTSLSAYSQAGPRKCSLHGVQGIGTSFCLEFWG